MSAKKENFNMSEDINKNKPLAAPLPEPMNLRNYEVGPEYFPNRIKEFETKYSVSSADFLVTYKARLCDPNNLDFIEWAALLDIQAHQDVLPLPEIASPLDALKEVIPFLNELKPNDYQRLARICHDAIAKAEIIPPVPLGEGAKLSVLPDNNGRFSPICYIAYCLEIRESELRAALASKSVPIEQQYLREENAYLCRQLAANKEWDAELGAERDALRNELDRLKAVPVGEDNVK